MLRRVVGLLFVCLLVGLLLAWLRITPQSLFTDAFATVERILRLAIDVGRWAIPYILLGAVVVVPVAILGFFFGRRGGRRS
jgi:hypothetical protein